ncbi:MAG: biotin/lipoyl-containing protein [Puniceicoccaceae bacterium]
MRKYELKVNASSFTIQVKEFTADEAELIINGKPYLVEVGAIEHDSMKSKVARKPIPTSSGGAAAGAPTPAKAPAPAASGDNAVTAPIPGKIMEIFVKEGDAVKVGQPVLKMEAMKMENVINATEAGTVGKIQVNEGDAVAQGQELILLG